MYLLTTVYFYLRFINRSRKLHIEVVYACFDSKAVLLHLLLAGQETAISKTMQQMRHQCTSQSHA